MYREELQRKLKDIFYLALKTDSGNIQKRYNIEEDILNEFDRFQRELKEARKQLQEMGGTEDE